MIDKGLTAGALGITAGLSLLAILPFAAWTFRNLALHTPHTFNMSNRFFFGLRGLAVYAPSHYRVDWIDADWKYPIYRVQYELVGLFESFVGEIPEAVPPLLAIGVGLVILVPGALLWLRRASNLERAFVLMLAAFMLYRTFKSINLYVITRYWLALLPFVSVMVLLGLRYYFELLRGSFLRWLPVAVAVALAILVVANFRSLTQEALSPGRAEYYRQAERVLRSMADHVSRETTEDTVFATTDWGVLPFYLDRVSYQMLNDEDHRLSLQRIRTYDAGALAILEEGSALAPYAMRMVADHPELFVELAVFEPEGPIGPRGFLYAIDLQRVAAYLDAESEPAATHR